MYGIFEVTVKNMIHPLEDLTYVGSGSAIKKKKKKKKKKYYQRKGRDTYTNSIVGDSSDLIVRD